MQFFRRFNLQVLLLLAAGSFLSNARATPPANTRYAPPEATFNAGNQLQIFQTELDRKNFDDAARRLDALLRDSPDALMTQPTNQVDDNSMLSVTAWASNLPAAVRTSIAQAYENIAGRAAMQSLADLRARRDADPAEYYLLAKRYSFTTAAASALAAGAERAAVLGDIPAARWMMLAALARGGVADPSLQHAIDTLDTTPAPASARVPGAAIGSGYTGPLPFSATWFGQSLRESWTSLRSFPTAAGGTIFAVAPGQVIAIKETGGLLWQGPVGEEPAPGKGAPDPEGVIRGPAFAAAVLSDSTASPQVVIVRQPEVKGDGWAVRALRASDGKLLWTTEGRDEYHGLVFGSNPTVEGRYVYAVAGDPGEQVDRLALLAIEVTTGRQLWRADIGTETRSRPPLHHHDRGKEIVLDAFRPWMNQSAPCVSGEWIGVCPNVGAAILVGRFDGKIRWAHSYDPLVEPYPGDSHRQLNVIGIAKSQQRFRKMSPGLSHRYSNTPGIVGSLMICAPEDSDEVFGLDLATGKQLWNSPALADATLVGTSGGIAVFDGPAISGVKITDGQVAWVNEPLKATAAGPSVLSNGLVLVPTESGITALKALDGMAVESAQKVPVFGTVLANPRITAALTATDVIGCFTRWASR